MTKEKRCHPELVSGSHYSIYPLVFVYKIYEMPKQVRHDIQEAGRYTDVNTPTYNESPIIFTLTRRLRVPLSPQGRGNFCHTEPTPNCPPPHTPNCHAELILNCHAELVSASLLQPTENQLRSPTQLCVLINADATHNESPIRGFALISSFLQN